MITLRIDGKDLKTISANLPNAEWGLDWKEKSLIVVSPYGATFRIRPRTEKGKLLLVAPWKDIKMVGVPSGKVAQMVWPKIKDPLATYLRDLKTQHNLPDGMLRIEQEKGWVGISIDIEKLGQVLTFVQGNLMFRWGALKTGDDYIEVGFKVSKTPPILTKNSDEEIPEEIPEEE